MEDLIQVYRDALAGRIEALEVARGTRADRGAESVATIRRIAHSLRGSGGTFGFPEITVAAAGVEDAPDVGLDTALDALLAVLRTVSRGNNNTARVLVVHGDPAVSKQLRDVVTPYAAEVIEAETRARARALLTENTFGMVLLGLALPDGDGRALLIDLREKEATADVPALVVAAGADAHQKAECFRLGADAFFDEPVDRELVGAVVSARLQRAPQAKAPPTRELPANEKPAAKELPSATPPAPRPAEVKPTPVSKTVLLVEDDAMVASILKHRLDREGFEVLHFSDGVQAMAAAEGKPLALAILDIKVPGMDGFDVLERLRKSPEAANVPIMMLSALGAEQDVVRCFGLGADDYIVKPFSPAEVMARLHRLLQRK
jgi:DNA-binding response OmpR family regulator